CRAKLTGRVYLNGYAHNSCSADAGDKGGRLSSLRANADGVGFGRNTFIADIDIVIACGQIKTGTTAQGDIAAAGFVAKERCLAIGRVVAASRVAIERCLTGGRVEVANSVVIER